MSVKKLRAELKSKANPVKAKFFPRFFKAGKGGYAEGDFFLGVTVPQTRAVAKDFSDLELKEITELLNSRIHEERLIALFILVRQFQVGDLATQRRIFKFYLSKTARVNNWDLVDTSAYHIVGGYLLEKDWAILKKLAKSKSLWERRIAIVSTYQFIRNKKLDPVFTIAQVLLEDSHDLIHKAVGWMLREAGKRDERRLRQFLAKNIKLIPRTTLRYAIEKFSALERQNILRYGIIKAT